jgi:MFS family permease
MRRAFQSSGFSGLYAALTTSAFGDSILLLVLSMWVKTVTGSNGQAGLTFFFMVIPSLFAPVFGMWIDRVRRKPLLVWGNALSALAVLPLVLVRGASDVWVIWTVAFLYGISIVILPAGVNGLLKELVPDEVLVGANAAIQTTKEGFRLVGPLIGAALFAWVGGWLLAVLDAVSFLIAATVIAAIPVGEEVPDPDRAHPWHEVTAGVRHLVGDRVLRHTLVGFGLMLLVLGFTEASIYAVLDAFDKPATFAGVAVTYQGVGAVIGGLSCGVVIRRLGEVGSTVLGMLLLAAPIGVIAGTSSLPVMLGALVVVGISLPLLFVAVNTLVQRRTPQALMGRVSMAVEVVTGTPQAVSLAVGSILVALVSYRVIFLTITVVTTLGAAHIAYRLRAQMRTDLVSSG